MADSFPERASRPYRRSTDPFGQHLHERWRAGCQNAAELYRELQERGFQGSYDMVRRRVARWRRLNEREPRSSGSKPRTNQAPIDRPSSNRVASLLLKSRSKRSNEEQELFAALKMHSPALQTATTLAREFVAMVRRRRSNVLDVWIERACSSELPVEICRFARGLIDDLDAVRAALSLPWSNGQTEGQVNRLKLRRVSL